MNHKVITTIVAIILVMSLIAGCSGGSVNQEGSNEQAAGEKLTINMAVQYWSGSKWAADHPTIQYLNEKFNIDLKLQFINGPEYAEKLKVMAASGNLPDFYRVDPDTYLKWQGEGAFVDLKPLLPNYPNLSEAFPADDPAVTILNPIDKNYGLPEISWLARDTIQVRKDWLEQLGIPVPDEEHFTVDQFYEIAKAFVQEDPDGNNQKDTIGFSKDNLALKSAFGLANEWIEKDGQLIPPQMQIEEQKAYLAFMRKAYEEGVLDQDFALRKSSDIEELHKSNKLGLFTYHNNYPDLVRQIKNNFPDSNPEIVPLAPPIGPEGQRGNLNWTVGTNKQVINAKASKEKQDRILQILDWWVTDEGTTVMKNGIEGIHYVKKEDGSYEVTDRWEPEMPRYLNSSLFKRPGTDFNLYLWTDEEEMKRNEQYAENVLKYQWPNAAPGIEYYSDTAKTKLANLNLKFEEAASKIIVGRSPIDSIADASAEWLANGGQNIIDEVNEAAAK
ncbi:extracellular solute-binding protein [Paenibacillus taichungensis]|uniref:extracellular solute-binding protein n=1 Tax=Paenibacillus taichungensis TaxID=484184 RepID=UPI00287212D5|nr:extracellular solute-binding protein [Paenibacillus taichungensis]MDR9746419.1 extracellular solute-binding protein [Paenibacillus taichungensis]